MRIGHPEAIFLGQISSDPIQQCLNAMELQRSSKRYCGIDHGKRAIGIISPEI
jgi:hypothetical protein